MNDPGLEDVIQDSAQAVNQRLEAEEKENTPDPNTEPQIEDQEGIEPKKISIDDNQELHAQRKHSRHPHQKGAQADQHRNDEEASIYQPTLWWFTSTAFPLFAGTFGPIANLLSVCALVESWRVHTDDGSRLRDPHWLTGLNATSLFLALVANLVLMFNFARRIRYAIAQPITITLWYISSILLIICICLVHTENPLPDFPIRQLEYSQSYYYGIISSVLYFSVSTLLLLSSLGSIVFHAYPPSFSALTGPQRTLMLQTTSFSIYLAIGAGVFAEIEDWAFTDGVYWADYTLLTIGLGTDFPLTTVLGRMLLIPYAAFGITLIGLVVTSVRALVLERAKAKVARRHLEKEREKWSNNINERRRAASEMAARTLTQESTMSSNLSYSAYRDRWKEHKLMRLPRQLAKHAEVPLKHEDQKGAWHRAEFELMRLIQVRSENREPYEALLTSFIVILIVWVGGTLIFWSCEHKIQGWTFPSAFYFTYTSLLTIGYGDFYPSSSAGKPFFVVWSLIAVPAMTVFISNMGDTVVKWLKEMTIWISQWTILPEKKVDQVDARYFPKANRPGQTSEKPNASSNKEGNEREVVENQTHIPPSPGPAVAHQTHQAAPSSSTRPSGALKADVEHLGNKVEHFEQSEGRAGSLAVRLAREISRLAKDLQQKPPKKYTWDEWSVWLTLLGERDDEQTSLTVPYREKLHPSSQGAPVQILTVPRSAGLLDRPKSAPTESQMSSTGEEAFTTSHEAGDAADAHLQHRRSATSIHPWVYNQDRGALSQSDVNSTSKDATDWRWTWLGDQGPLFSRLTETEWIMERLCFRLEEVLEDEIREAHALANERNRTPSQ